MNWTLIWSSALILFFILDPFGNIPVLLSLLKKVEHKKRFPIIIRECLIGLSILIMFLFFGKAFLDIFHLETAAVTVAGAIILFIIGIRLIFPDPNKKGQALDEEAFIVPIAMPMIAGPSALATLLVMSNNSPDGKISVLISLLIAWSISTIILLSSPFLYRILKEKGLKALERLMGMLLLMMSVQMLINGIRDVIAGG